MTVMADWCVLLSEIRVAFLKRRCIINTEKDDKDVRIVRIVRILASFLRKERFKSGSEEKKKEKRL